MFKYVNSGFNLISDLEFPFFSPFDGAERTEITIKAGNISDKFSAFSRPGAYFMPEKVLFYNDFCYMIINSDGIVYENRKEHSQGLTTFISGYGLALLFHIRGEIGIHAGAISDGENIFLISGYSGAGKSSVTANLLERGLKLAADDMVRTKKESNALFAYPSFPMQKLCVNELFLRGIDFSDLKPVDGEDDKFFVPVNDRSESNKLPVKSLIFIKKADVDELKIRILSGKELLKVFSDCVFILHLSDTEFNKPEFMIRLLKHLECIKVYEIERPEDKNTLNEVTEIVDKLIKGDDSRCYLS